MRASTTSDNNDIGERESEILFEILSFYDVLLVVNDSIYKTKWTTTSTTLQTFDAFDILSQNVSYLLLKNRDVLYVSVMRYVGF